MSQFKKDCTFVLITVLLIYGFLKGISAYFFPPPSRGGPVTTSLEILIAPAMILFIGGAAIGFCACKIRGYWDDDGLKLVAFLVLLLVFIVKFYKVAAVGCSLSMVLLPVLTVVYSFVGLILVGIGAKIGRSISYARN